MIVARCLALVACIGLVPAPAVVQAQPTMADDMVGIWAAEITFAPALRGQLTIVRDGSAWRATIANAKTSFQSSGAAIRFAFPGNRGQFRGRLTEGGHAIAGFWLQPAAGASDPKDPGGAGQAFAAPLILQGAGRGIWRGMVNPLDDRFTLYLKVYRNAEGVLVGAFRNPEMNSNGGASLFRVTREGDALAFSARLGETEPETRLTSTVVSSTRLCRQAVQSS